MGGFILVGIRGAGGSAERSESNCMQPAVNGQHTDAHAPASTAAGPPSSRPNWSRCAAAGRNALFWAACGGTVLALFGRRGWPFELFCHFPVLYFWLLITAAVLFGRRREPCRAAAAAALAGWNLWLFAPAYWPARGASAGASRFRLLALNVHAESDAFSAVRGYLRDADADIVLLIEFNRKWAKNLRDLEQRYPYRQVVTPGSSVGLFSRVPLRNVRVEHVCRDRDNTLIAELVLGERRCTLVAVHPVSPHTAELLTLRNRQLEALAELVRGIGGPCVLVGDLNVTPWSPFFRDFVERSGLHDSRRGFGIHSTWPDPLPAFLRIPIDHCLHSPDMRVVRRRVGPPVGSDHRPIVLELSLSL